MSINILVTGAGGFIGSHLVEKLAERDSININALVHYNSRNDHGWLNNINKKNVNIIKGDIQSFDSVYNAMRGCLLVFHLAALIGIPYSYETPDSYISTNIEGTNNILKASRMLGVKKIVHTSTSEIYGGVIDDKISEAQIPNPKSPYAASKLAADHLALSYYYSYDLPVVIARPFNTYGPRQSDRAVIPTIIKQILAGGDVHLGNIKTTRDFNFVLDTVYGFLKCGTNKSVPGEIYNIGSGKEFSIESIYNILKAKMRDNSINLVVEESRMRPDKSEVQRLKCDNTKIVQNLGWHQRYDIGHGLLLTEQWFRDNINLYKKGYSV